MRKSRKSRKNTIMLIVILTGLACATGPVSLETRSVKNIILVLDTSISMSGQREHRDEAGADIINTVHMEITRLIDNSLAHGSRVRFITFDEEVKINPVMIVDNENDRYILKKYISMSEIQGERTNISKMLRKAIAAADEQAKEDPENRVEIIIFSDGIHNSSSRAGNNFINLGFFAGKRPAGKRWRYHIQVEELRKGLGKKVRQ
ncbi:MAG: VWA domain-containing protein [bacterium]|nr:VWA domain-containing protein [bacterium]